MSNDKEFEIFWKNQQKTVEKKNEEIENFEKAYAEIFWKNQQKTIEKKDAEIERYRKLYAFMKDRKNNDWFLTNADMFKLNSLMKALSEVESE